MAPPPSPLDLPSLLFAQAALSLSRTQRLVSSWLPPPTEAELQSARAPSDLEKEEDGVFTASNELAGLGAKYTEEDENAVKVLRSDEKLKIQLMGRDWVKRQERKGGSSGGTAPLRVGSKPKPAAMVREDDGGEDSEHKGGRSSLGRVKVREARDGKAESGGMVEDAEDSSDGARIPPTMPVSKRLPKRGICYLDEVLAKKAEKEQKKQRRKAQHSNAMEHIDNPDDLQPMLSSN